VSGPDLVACAAWRQAATVLSPSPHRAHPAPLVAPEREHKPTPTCAEGGPHRYPPGRETACTVCGIDPGTAAVEGLRRITAEHAERKLSEAFG
jgi:hypothetical protein